MNDFEKKLEETTTAIGVMAEMTGLFYTSLASVPGLNGSENDIDRHVLTRAFIDSLFDHIFGNGAQND